MGCYSPVARWESCVVNKSGKRSLTDNPANARKGAPVQMSPCGKCLGCHAQHAAVWSLRCQHEASLHRLNAFVTLTYDEASCPGVLVKRDIQLFFKRLRKNTGLKIRYFYCGEFGDLTHRPHFHILFFGQDFRDPWSRGSQKYTSQVLEKAWGHGIVDCGDVEAASCNYVTRYALKKSTGDRNVDFMSDCSRKPGIAGEWIDKYWSDIARVGYVAIGKSKLQVPPYYYRRYPDELAHVKEASRDYAASRTPTDLDEFELRLVGKQLNDTARRSLHSRSVL